MKTKQYEFTEIEIMAIRDALDFYWHGQLKKLNPLSPLFKLVRRAVRTLSQQFKADVFKI